MVIQELQNSTYLAEALFFPEISRFNDQLLTLQEAFGHTILEFYKNLNGIDIYHRHYSGEPQIKEINVTITPPKKNSSIFPHPQQITFQFIYWFHESGFHRAYLPALSIQTVGKSKQELEQHLEMEIFMTLHPYGNKFEFESLFWVQRIKKIHLIKKTTPVEYEGRLHKKANKTSSLESRMKKKLDTFSSKQLMKAFEYEKIYTSLAKRLKKHHRENILLIGPSGVGKTALTHELIRNRFKLNLKDAHFYGTNGAQIVSSSDDGYGGWQKLCQDICNFCTKQPHLILVLGNLFELMNVGQGSHIKQSVADFFKPYIYKGQIQIIVECTKEQFALMEQQDARFVNLFKFVHVDPPDDNTLRLILDQYAKRLDQYHHVQFEETAMEMIFNLLKRFSFYSAMPGKAIHFMDKLSLTLENHHVITQTHVIESFARETGLPLFIIDESNKMDVNQVEKWFSTRLIGQKHAVEQILHQIMLIKAGLNARSKPICSLLFIGPTGVGKTELSKLLAKFFFGSVDRITRFDMSEYSNPLSIHRLIGGGAQSTEGLLTSKIREKPFSVLLFDEIEKAHSQLFDLLLQVLGEGRLTDMNGDIADLTNTIIILTSNLGSHVFQKDRPGFGKMTSRKSLMDDIFDEVNSFFRSEFINRIDRIVPFYPLDQQSLEWIARRELKQIETRDGFSKNRIQMKYDSAVFAWLSKKGFDPKYGARPLKRCIERYVLLPLSEIINNNLIKHKGTTSTVRLQIVDNELKTLLEPIPKKGHPKKTLDKQKTNHLEAITSLRRKLQKVLSSVEFNNFLDKMYYYTKRMNQVHQKMKKKGAFVSEKEHHFIQDAPEMIQLNDWILRLYHDLCRLEKQHLLHRYYPDQHLIDNNIILETYEHEWKDFLFKYFAFKHKEENRAYLFFYGLFKDEVKTTMMSIVNSYKRVLGCFSERVSLYVIKKFEQSKIQVKVEQIQDLNKIANQLPQHLLGIMIHAKGNGIKEIFRPGYGFHRIIKKNNLYFYIENRTDEFFTENNKLIRSGTFTKGICNIPRVRQCLTHHWTNKPSSPIIRSYDFDEGMIEDKQFKMNIPFNKEELPEGLVQFVNKTVYKRCMKLFDL